MKWQTTEMLTDKEYRPQMATEKPSLFIGSSADAIHIAKEIAVQIENDADATVWSLDIFTPGESNLESLVNSLPQFDFAALLLTPDKSLEGDHRAAPRDNVVFELGLFMGHLGRERTLIVAESGVNLKLPSDLEGIVRIDYQSHDDPAKTVSTASFKIVKHMTKVGRRNKASEFFVASYEKSQQPAFFNEVVELVPRAKTITLIATGLNLIWSEAVVDILIGRALSSEAEITICMANPYSPHVLDRLVEEEMAGRRPPVGRHGISHHVDALIRKIEKAGNPEAMRVCLFENYPTFATLIFDDDIFVYPYAYQVLGTTSPIFHFRNNGSAEAQFFLDNARRIVDDSVPAVDVISTRIDRRYFSQRWIGAAIFAIPDRDDSFYQFGSSVIGFDIREPGQSGALQLAQLELDSYVGEARQYGLHATIADALYFASDAQIDRISAELKVLAEDLSPFELTGLTVAGIPNEEFIVVLCEDESGVVEAIHHELVSRMYGLAISSNYLTGHTKRTQDVTGARDHLMLKRYGAPYILNKFLLHFTLLSAPPTETEERSRISEQLQTRLMETVPSGKTHINELCLMTKTSADEQWKIRERFPLGSR